MHRILKIDGDYFANRVIGYLNMGDSVNNLQTKNEIDSFRAALNQSIISLYNTFSPFIDNIIFVKDNNSWRKSVEPHRPYYISENVLIGYKEQRIEKKEESPIDYTVFREVYSQFVDDLKTFLPVFDIEGLEGDDNLMLLSNKHNNENIFSVVFCTDGDLMQVVKDNCMLMRNIKSKNSPFGDFVMTYNSYTKIFEQNIKDAFLKNNVDSLYFKQLFQISITGGVKVKRQLNEGIDIATPFKVALIKSICGDKKDNLFSILSWKSETGTMMYKLTENIISKVLAKQKVVLTENVCKNILSDKDQLINLIFAIIDHHYDKLKLPEDEEKVKEFKRSVFKHLKHNLKMNVLTPTNLPEDKIEAFNKVYEAYEKQIKSKIDYTENFKKFAISKKDSAINILESSIPEIK